MENMVIQKLLENFVEQIFRQWFIPVIDIYGYNLNQMITLNMMVFRLYLIIYHDQLLVGSNLLKWIWIVLIDFFSSFFSFFCLHPFFPLYPVSVLYLYIPGKYVFSKIISTFWRNFMCIWFNWSGRFHKSNGYWWSYYTNN